MKVLFTSFSVLILSSLFGQTSFSGKPIYEMDIERADTSIGVITLEMYPSLAPLHVANFDSLVSNNLYDSTAFHRVIPGFMIQGGGPNSRGVNAKDPSTWGQSVPGQQTVPAEFSTVRHTRGIISAARSNNINSASSQFFICVANANHLNGAYSIYGHVIDGMDVVDLIVSAPRNENDLPDEKIQMFITRIGENIDLADTVVLNEPEDGDTLDANGATFFWELTDDGLEYEIEVSTESDFSTIYASERTTAKSIFLDGFPLESAQLYWRVKSNNGGFVSTSESRTFQTPNTVSVTNFDSTDELLVYPNPANSMVTIENIDKPMIAVLYHLSGKRLQSYQLEKGLNTINIEELATGIYLLSTPKGVVKFKKQ